MAKKNKLKNNQNNNLKNQEIAQELDVNEVRELAKQNKKKNKK